MALYKSIIGSIIDYSAVISICKIESTKKRMQIIYQKSIKKILNLPVNCSNKIFEILKIEPIQHRQKSIVENSIARDKEEEEVKLDSNSKSTIKLLTYLTGENQRFLLKLIGKSNMIKAWVSIKEIMKKHKTKNRLAIQFRCSRCT